MRTRRVYPLHLDLLKYRTPYLLYSPLIVFLTYNKSVYPSVLMLQGELAINCPVQLRLRQTNNNRVLQEVEAKVSLPQEYLLHLCIEIISYLFQEQ